LFADARETGQKAQVKPRGRSGNMVTERGELLEARARARNGLDELEILQSTPQRFAARHCQRTGRLRQDHKKTKIGLPTEPRTIAMRYSSQVKPISYLKANAAEVLAQLAAGRQPLVITQNGEAKAVLQDVASFEQTQETLALLKILALGNQDVAAGKVKPASDVITRLRAKRTVG
jgi:prevent-host-death family protein